VYRVNKPGTNMAGDVTSMTLLERALASDQTAWGRLLHVYSPLVTHWCLRWGVRDADAEDVRQEVFQAVAVRLPQFRREVAGDTFRGWLRGITRHKLLDHFRHRERQLDARGGSDAQQRLLQVPEPSDPLTESAVEETNLYHRALDLVRAEFEERTWTAFWRVAIDGQPVDVIAAELNISPASVRKYKSRVLHRLREEVGDLLD
jgi:RNA polymerase sigma-70 factor, ECF subfamily